MYIYAFPRPSVTATIFMFYNGMLVVGTRSDDSDAYPGMKAIPGGFLNAKVSLDDCKFTGDATTFINDVPTAQGETVEETAIRETKEECSIELSGEQLVLFHEHSNPDTDPRAHVVNLCYIAHLTLEQVERLSPGDDLKALDLVDIRDIAFGLQDNWAFNHLSLAKLAIHVYRFGGDYFRNEGIWKI